ncbi:endolytic transglycosylase MltG [Limibacter armeniacum]|uniref:endolytic transglycosylase MltG n=1 Tax=Limibacter armeniacum TaxID=466084 RepID=UPI002FE6C1B8
MNKRFKRLIYIFIGISALAITVIVYGYQTMFTPNIMTTQDEGILFIPENATIQDVTDSLVKHEYVNDIVSFRFVSKLMHYNDNVKPGRYLLKRDMTNREAVSVLRSGLQQPVKVTFSHARTLEDLAPVITKNIRCTPEAFMAAVTNPEVVQKLGFDTVSVRSMFIPNTYELYWNTDVNGLLERMKYEYEQFWTKDRKAKAEKLGLSPLQVTTLASIVQAETIKGDEKPRVAGLYMNRLNRNMLLQSDPTVVYALGDFTKKRILTKDLEVDSPYNTYKHTGLPPGPINIANIQSIDAVLNMEKHKYIYMCAKEDFSGYHNFAESHREHINNANRYQRALSKAKIYK